MALSLVQDSETSSLSLVPAQTTSGAVSPSDADPSTTVIEQTLSDEEFAKRLQEKEDKLALLERARLERVQDSDQRPAPAISNRDHDRTISNTATSNLPSANKSSHPRSVSPPTSSSIYSNRNVAPVHGLPNYVAHQNPPPTQPPQHHHHRHHSRSQQRPESARGDNAESSSRGRVSCLFFQFLTIFNSIFLFQCTIS